MAKKAEHISMLTKLLSNCGYKPKQTIKYFKFQFIASSSRLFSSNNVEEKFHSTVNQLKEYGKDPPNDLKLKLYGLYKVSTEGYCNITKPSMFDMIGQAKYRVWKDLDNITKEQAMEEYIKAAEMFVQPKVNFAPANDNSSTTISPTKTSTDVTVDSIAYPRRQKKISSLQLNTIEIIVNENNSGVVTIKLNRPNIGNAFNMEMWNDMKVAFDAVNHDHTVKCVILTGNSQSFSTGMDLSVFSEFNQVHK